MYIANNSMQNSLSGEMLVSQSKNVVKCKTGHFEFLVQRANMVTSGFKVELTTGLDVWRSATTMSGELCVMISGAYLMLK